MYLIYISIFQNDISHLQYLDCLWAQIENLRRNGWLENQITRPYLAFDAVTSEALEHAIPPLMPPAHDDDCRYPLPSVVFRMFDYLDVPEVRFLYSLLIPLSYPEIRGMGA